MTMTNTPEPSITLTREHESCRVTIDQDGYLVVSPAHAVTGEQIAAVAPDFVAMAQQIRRARIEADERRHRHHRHHRHPGCTVIASVEPDATGVGMRGYSIYVASGQETRRAADEGLDHHGGGAYPFRAAVLEAEERSRRVARVEQIGREGYTLADYDEARQLIDDGRSLADGRRMRSAD